MAIDPAQIITKQLKELPPAPFSDTDNIAHEVGDILSRGTLGELITYLQSKSISYQYEIKYIRAPGDGSAYINANFDMTVGPNQGIGKVGGIWEGWQICNGNNGTDNLDGQILIGYGANNPAIGQFVGNKTHTLSQSELPRHRHLNGVSNDNLNPFVYGGATTDMPGSAVAEVRDEGGSRIYQGYTNYSGSSSPSAFELIQPSMVILAIMKL